MTKQSAEPASLLPSVEQELLRAVFRSLAASWVVEEPDWEFDPETVRVAVVPAVGEFLQ